MIGMVLRILEDVPVVEYNYKAKGSGDLAWKVHRDGVVLFPWDVIASGDSLVLASFSRVREKLPIEIREDKTFSFQGFSL